MFVLHESGIERLSFWGETIVVEAVLALILVPALSLLVYRPFHLQLQKLRAAEEGIRERDKLLVQDISLRHELILSTAQEGIVGLDGEGRVTFINSAAETFLGWPRAELIGADHHELFHHSHAGGSSYRKERCPIHFTLATGSSFHQIEEFFWRKDGLGFPVELSCAAMEEGTGAVVTFRDIGERKADEEKIHAMAYFDSLTGLPNRLLLQDRFSQLLAQCKREQKRLALMYLDLDDFKRINDTYGHAAGDFFLAEQASRIRSCIRANDTVARMSGDEFVWTGMLVKPEEVSLVAEKIIAALRQTVSIGDASISTTVSIGIALYPHDGTDLAALIEAADTAMYDAKTNGKSSFCHNSGKPPLRVLKTAAVPPPAG